MIIAVRQKIRALIMYVELRYYQWKLPNAKSILIDEIKNRRNKWTNR